MNFRLKWLKHCIAACFALLFFTGSVLAQEIKLSGTVTSSEDGSPLPGVSVIEKGTTRGTTTDIDGIYNINVNPGATVVFSFIGMEPYEMNIGSTPPSLQNVALQPLAIGVDEVVVTALGMRRAQKSLGYAVTELKGDDLRSNSVNPVASLQGKVAGVDITNSDGGLFGSTKIQIRGASTLTNNQQPIYVVDGIILDNAVSSSGDTDWAGNADDFGNVLKNLNPDDFETVSILKGPQQRRFMAHGASMAPWSLQQKAERPAKASA